MNRTKDRARTPEAPPALHDAFDRRPEQLLGDALDEALQAVAARPAAANAGVPAGAAASLASSLLVHVHKRCHGAVRTGEDIDTDEAYAFAVLIDLALSLYSAAGEPA